MGRKPADVAKNVIGYVRLPLLSPEELKDVEVENSKDHLITVSMAFTCFREMIATFSS